MHNDEECQEYHSVKFAAKISEDNGPQFTPPPIRLTRNQVKQRTTTRTRTSKKDKEINQCWRWTIISYLVILATLWAIGISYQYHQATQTYELAVGSTMILSLGPLWPRTMLKIQSKTPQVEIYEVVPVLLDQVAECPLVNGPSVELHSEQEFTLDREEFVFNSVYLNAGSSIQVQVHHFGESKGITNVYLLKGLRYFESLEHHHHDMSVHDFRSQSIRKELVGSRGGAVFKFDVEENDYYTIVYCNDSWEVTSSQLKSITNISATTHNLDDMQPICSKYEVANKECSWDLSNEIYRQHLPISCFIAKAVASDGDAINPSNGLQTAEFRVGGPFRYEPLAWLTIFPLSILLFFCTVKIVNKCLQVSGALSVSSSEQTLLLHDDQNIRSLSSSERSYHSTA
eukprot:scaffold6355_cov119-Cylindrotheca_fusiformis.AAC.7